MKAWISVLPESKDKNLGILKLLRRWTKEDLHTATTWGAIDKELLKVTPIFLEVAEQRTFSEICPFLLCC